MGNRDHFAIFRRLVQGSAAIACLAAGLSTAGASAQSESIHVAPVMRYINGAVRSWISDPVIIESLKAQNQANKSLGPSEILALDKEWRSEVDALSRPMIDKVMATRLSQFLRTKEDDASGTITEIFVVDAKGLNVGQSAVTSDYWQGDEDKFTKSFGAGPKAMFVDAPRMDESTQILQSQVSMTIVDEQNHPIGAIVVGVNLDQL